MKNRMYLTVGIVILTLATAIIHAVVGVQDRDNLLILNALGYGVLLCMFLVPAFKVKHRWVTSLLLIYTIITFVGYFVMHADAAYAHGSDRSAEAKTVEVEEGVEGASGDQEVTSAKEISDLPPLAERVGNIEHQKPFPIGEVAKGIEALLIVLLLIDLKLGKTEAKTDSL